MGLAGQMAKGLTLYDSLHFSFLLLSPLEGGPLLGECSQVLGVLQEDAGERGQGGRAPEEGLDLLAGGGSWVPGQA